MNGIPPEPFWSGLYGNMPMLARVGIAVFVTILALCIAIYIGFPALLQRRSNPAGALWSSTGLAVAISAVFIGLAMAPEWGWLWLGCAILVGGLFAAVTVLFAAGQE